VHLSEKAVEPPGEARADLDILLDYARRMDFRDKDGGPLIPWTDAESAFEAWKACSRGRPCDYTGLTYDRLRDSAGIQWPCTDDSPDGTERLYTDGQFNTDPDHCESFGHDLATGAAFDESSYRAKEPKGRAFLHGDGYRPAPEQPSDDYPLLLTTGRSVYHFHTRTKTARAPQLDAAAPAVWVELSVVDAGAMDIHEGDLVRVQSPRGAIQAPVRIAGIRPGVVFVPFHYGYWDQADGTGADRDGNTTRTAANELTETMWDPVSKQPLFKVAAVNVTLLERGTEPSPAPTVGGSAPADADAVAPTIGGRDAEVTVTTADPAEPEEA
jgi:anaerobic selenocysteine-containing dehydrogenase